MRARLLESFGLAFQLFRSNEKVLTQGVYRMSSVILLSRARPRWWREHVRGWDDERDKKVGNRENSGRAAVGEWEGGPWLMSRAMSVFLGGRVLCHQPGRSKPKVRPPSRVLPPSSSVLSILSFSMARWFPRGANKGQQGAVWRAPAASVSRNNQNRRLTCGLVEKGGKYRSQRGLPLARGRGPSRASSDCGRAQGRQGRAQRGQCRSSRPTSRRESEGRRAGGHGMRSGSHLTAEPRQARVVSKAERAGNAG